ncbi:MAG: hypothetical protein GY847_22345 [Proteobacteria bacterium]|nr:hypothetical protein [Pseudomonadota bacterium]
MKRITLVASMVVIVFAVYFMSCMDRKPGPVCPVPIEVAINKSLVGGFDGVDLLVVVDNSGSMEQEQEILSTGFFTLVNSLVKPIQGPDWNFPPVVNMRVAVVSTNLGLQYGADHSTKGFPYGDTVVTSCTDKAKKGDDGVFQTDMDGIIEVNSGEISCADNGNQCPSDDWSCADGKCISPSGDKEPVNCLELASGKKWAETSENDSNPDLASQLACLGKLGTGGCGMEQQLESSVVALSRSETQKNFMKESHLLAVLIVSDEEDCSIRDKGLFSTDEWESGTRMSDDAASGLLNTACNLPADNEEQYLFPTTRYYKQLVALKKDQPKAVIFAAIVGVPPDGEGEGEESICQGRGNDLSTCLGDPDMELQVEVQETDEGQSFKHFAPACERTDDNDNTITSARPGRRYVQVAQEFTSNGYVYSICNADWSPAMKEIARVIAENITGQCYAKQLEWTPSGTPECKGCGKAKCQVLVSFTHPRDQDTGCPGSFSVNPNEVSREYDEDEVTVFCPLPKLNAELDCDKAKERYAGTKQIGWYYCEDQNENFEGTCRDGIDNDDDGDVDCEDEQCADCKDACGGTGVQCEVSCKFGIEITPEAKKASRGQQVDVQCLQQFSFEDENCQENSLESCKDGKDNDGNGLWDCNDEMGKHFADPNCCPMTAKNQKCEYKLNDIKDVCKKGGDGAATSKTNLPDACSAHALMLNCNM